MTNTDDTNLLPITSAVTVPATADNRPIDESETPGACSGPLPPAGGHSPARPSSSAVSGERGETETGPRFGLSATYSPEDNKLRLCSATRLDRPTYDRLKAAGFAWAPKQDLFVAPMWTPQRADLLIELCGEIGDEDTSLVERAEQRADRFEGYHESRTADAETARQAVAAIADNIPLGQPILVGHHSERHARKDAQRIENGMRRAVKMWETATYWKARAAGAIRHARYKERPDVRHRRIKGLESDLRNHQKQIALSETLVRIWGKDGLTREQATYIANRDHVNIRQEGGSTSLWSLLDAGEMTAAQAAATAIPHHERVSANARRWVEHITNRLAYERAMLDESGWVPPAKAKTKADLPLLNYSGEIAYRNPWRNGEIVRTQAVGITKAQLAAIHVDYKGTRLSECGTHRIRTAMISEGNGARVLVAVYMTDSKQHARPTAEAVSAQADAEERAVDDLVAAKLNAAKQRAAAPRPAPAAASPFEAMRESLRSGVQVVTADQLFPTPPELAARMVELADLKEGHRLLEPSAGTGALLDAVRAAGVTTETIAVEINEELAWSLRHRFEGAQQGDFLAMPARPQFDRVLMNPPFANAQDITHILQARRMLKPHGRLVAICANGPRQQEKLKPLVAECGGIWEELPAGTFAGTAVRAVLLTLTA